MVQLVQHSALSNTNTRKANRRALIASRYAVIRAFGTVHVPASEARQCIAETVTRTLPRGLSRIPFSDTPEADEVGGEAVSRFASADECTPRHMAGSDPVLSPAERARLRLDVALARDHDEWAIGRAAPCGWLLVAGR